MNTSIRHGTSGAYRYHGCRCGTCTTFVREHNRAYRARVRSQPMPDFATHGSEATYQTFACRCEQCRAAHSAYWQARKAAKRGPVKAPQTFTPGPRVGGWMPPAPPALESSG